MRALLEGGLVDAGHATSTRPLPSLPAADGEGAAADSRGGEAGWVAVAAGAFAAQNHSVPTLINEDAMHATAMRLDYAMLNAPLAERCVVSSWLTRDAETERLSDHYPLLTDLDCEG